MKKEEYSNILNILKKSYNAILNRDSALLRELSNHTLHTASISQDEDAVTIAVMIYSFSKIFERNYNEYKDWDKFYSSLKEGLKKAIKTLERNNIQEYELAMKEIISNLNKLDSKLRDYIKIVLESARIHKASRIHEHGISVGRTSELLGISEWELMEYVGKTGISDVPMARTVSISERMKTVRSIFR